MDYSLVKTVHQTAVALSVTGFFARGGLMLAGSPLASTRLARTLPHVVDSVLLVSALAMVGMLRLNPAHAPWLATKIVGVLVYIGFGVVALRPGTPGRVRAAAWVAALLTAAWIASVAITKNPLGLLSALR
jgi:uncharacterized membrane protein SirB2